MTTWSRLTTCSLWFTAVLGADQTLAIDPTAFRRFLGIDIEELQSGGSDFAPVLQRFGPSKQINEGDASEGISRVEYLSPDRAQLITFLFTECDEGYRVQTNVRSGSTIAVLPRSAGTIEVAGVRLGMTANQVNAVFAGNVQGGWTRVRTDSTPTMRTYSYRKTIQTDRGPFCDQLAIMLTFDQRGKLGEFEISSGGCWDSACDDSN